MGDFDEKTAGFQPLFAIDEESLKESLKSQSGDNKNRPWIEDVQARQSIFSSFTCFYALTLVILGLILELSHVLYTTSESKTEMIKDVIFSVYMYGGSLCFLIFCHAVYLNASWSRPFASTVNLARQHLDSRSRKMQLSRMDSVALLRASHSNPTTGSLYLRLGCVVFGVFGIVYYGLNLVVCLLGWSEELNHCDWNTLVVSVLATVFIFIQTHFIFCNSQISFHGSVNIARWGMMHLMATNLWTWLRYIIMREYHTSEELSHGWIDGNTTIVHDLASRCHGASCIFGNFSEFMYTCVVEYSLICAGTTFIFWKNVERSSNRRSRDCRKIAMVDEIKLKRNNIISVDCSKTSTGLFLGFIFICFTLICIALFNAYVYSEKMSSIANWVFFSTDALLFMLSSAACIYALYRMRHLNFIRETNNSAKLLDEILLLVGQIGEMIFSFGSLMALAGNIEWTYVTGLLLLVLLLRVIQVFLQTTLLRIGSSLRAETEDAQRKKPGKQVITFLLIANIALFLMNIFEAQKAGMTADVVRNYGSRSWALLVRGVSPLTIFYRFHSSVCFADIWKHSFRSPRMLRV